VEGDADLKCVFLLPSSQADQGVFQICKNYFTLINISRMIDYNYD